MALNPFGFSFSDEPDIGLQIDILKRLQRPSGRVDVVLDTDTFNEVDDQFALAYLLASEDKVNVRAIYAAPFFNHHSTSPADGMEKSYQEIFHVFSLLHIAPDTYPVYKGADKFLPDEQTPVASQAVSHLIALAKEHTPDNPLYVIGIAAATDIASALLIAPEIADRIFVIWLGGMGFDWHDNNSFNAKQDIAAARVLLAHNLPLVLLPGRGVVDHFHTSGPELKYWLAGKNEFCDYMIKKTTEEAALIYGAKVWSRPLSDVVAVAWLISPDFMLDRLEPSPIMEYDRYYAHDFRRHYIRYVYAVNRDALMQDLFSKLAAGASV